jgi:hypothetical protein
VRRAPPRRQLTQDELRDQFLNFMDKLQKADLDDLPTLCHHLRNADPLLIDEYCQKLKQLSFHDWSDNMMSFMVVLAINSDQFSADVQGVITYRHSCLLKWIRNNSEFRRLEKRAFEQIMWQQQRHSPMQPRFVTHRRTNDE